MSVEGLRHVGIVMDGNRRWAKKNGKRTIEGHKAGYKALKSLLTTVKELDIEFVSVYAFSTENWKRSNEEVDGILGLLRFVYKNELRFIIKQGIRVRWLGSRENVPAGVVSMLEEVEQKTQHLTEGTLAVCFNYGGQQEIAEAAQAVVSAGQELNVENIEKNLYQSDIPPIDLLIRTSGEQRVSNFMLWRAAYSELYFTDTLWPDFDGLELATVVKDYYSRTRRFGL